MTVYLCVLPGGDEADFQLNLILMLLINLKPTQVRSVNLNKNRHNYCVAILYIEPNEIYTSYKI